MLQFSNYSWTSLSTAGVSNNAFSFQLGSACGSLIRVANLISATFKMVFLNNN